MHPERTAPRRGRHLHLVPQPAPSEDIHESTRAVATGAEDAQALAAVTDFIWLQMQGLAVSSRVRAGLLAIHAPLAESLGRTPLRRVPAGHVGLTLVSP
jgi:hypothetical protein